VITIRMPARYARQAPKTVVPNPIVSEFTPAIGLFGMTTPYAITRVGRTNASNGPKYLTLMARTLRGRPRSVAPKGAIAGRFRNRPLFPTLGWQSGRRGR
jgi:hypothetical protein